MVDLAALDANLKLPEARMPDGATFVQPVGVPDGTGAGHAVNRGQLAAATRTLAAGANVTITDAGGVVTIAATGGGAAPTPTLTAAQITAAMGM